MVSIAIVVMLFMLNTPILKQHIRNVVRETSHRSDYRRNPVAAAPQLSF
jgi:hypothetical protein